MLAHVRPPAAAEIQMVFLDIDGTIVSNQRLVPSAAKAVELLHARGILVALCTGRSVLHAEPIERQLRVPYGIYFNGGLVHACGHAIAERPLERGVVRRMLHFFPKEHLPIILHTGRRALAPLPIPERIRPILQAYDYPPVEILSSPDDPWCHGAPLASSSPGTDDEGLQPLTQTSVYQANVFMDATWDARVQNEFPECLLYRWDPGAVDLQRRGCDKSHGALELLEHLGIPPEHALHVGDGGNDIGMFQAMGWSIAMGNASPEVQRHARMVTAPADEDGVYRALRDLGLI